MRPNPKSPVAFALGVSTAEPTNGDTIWPLEMDAAAFAVVEEIPDSRRDTAAATASLPAREESVTGVESEIRPEVTFSKEAEDDSGESRDTEGVSTADGIAVLER